MHCSQCGQSQSVINAKFCQRCGASLPHNPAQPPVPPSIWHSPIVIALLCLCCFPVGLILTWLHPAWTKQTKWIITGIVALFAVISVATNKEQPVSVSAPAHEATQDTSAPPTPFPTATLSPQALKLQQEDAERGPKPDTLSWDNTVIVADQYLQQTLHDYDSAKFQGWAIVTRSVYKKQPCWMTQVHLRAKNQFGAYRLVAYRFFIRQGVVIGVEEIK